LNLNNTRSEKLPDNRINQKGMNKYNNNPQEQFSNFNMMPEPNTNNYAYFSNPLPMQMQNNNFPQKPFLNQHPNNQNTVNHYTPKQESINENPINLIIKNYSYKGWVIIDNDVVVKSFNSHELLNFLDQEIKEGKNIQSYFINDCDADFHFNPSFLYESLKESLPKLMDTFKQKSNDNDNSNSNNNQKSTTNPSFRQSSNLVNMKNRMNQMNMNSNFINTNLPMNNYIPNNQFFSPSNCNMNNMNFKNDFIDFPNNNFEFNKYSNINFLNSLISPNKGRVMNQVNYNNEIYNPILFTKNKVINTNNNNINNNLINNYGNRKIQYNSSNNVIEKTNLNNNFPINNNMSMKNSSNMIVSNKYNLNHNNDNPLIQNQNKTNLSNNLLLDNQGGNIPMNLNLNVNLVNSDLSLNNIYVQSDNNNIIQNPSLFSPDNKNFSNINKTPNIQGQRQIEKSAQVKTIKNKYSLTYNKNSSDQVNNNTTNNKFENK